MPAVNFPNGLNIQSWGVTFDDTYRKVVWNDGNNIVRWTDSPMTPSALDALVWDLTGTITINKLAVNNITITGFGTGYVKSTAGVLSVQAVPIPVADGGTGATTFAAGYVKSPGGTGAFVTQATPIPVADGGTGATTLASGAYLKGAGAGAITTQATPIPTADLGSGAASASTFLRGDQTWAVPTAVVRSWLAGCQLSNDGGSPNTIIDVSAGQATSDDQTTTMNLSAITGTTGGTFVVGTGQPKLDAGAVAINTWYHVFVIERTDTSVVDILFSTSATSPAMPANYTKKRRIGSFKTAAATTNILAFTQDGDYFRWSASVQDVVTTPGVTTAVTITFPSVPLGVSTQAIINSSLVDTAGSALVYISDLAAADEAPAVTAPGFSIISPSANATGGGGPTLIRVNTSQQARLRTGTTTATYRATVLGWYDQRGKNL